MSILHISTSDKGGAGIAAIRLHNSMIENGVDSRFLCLNKTKSYPQVLQFPKFYPRFFHRFFAKIGLPMTAIEKREKLLRRLSNFAHFEIYSLPISDYRLQNHEAVRSADIIILHWVSGFVDYRSFFKNIPNEKKIFWYSHDFNPVLGGFHTLFDLSKNNNSKIKKLEEKLIGNKRAYLKSHKNLKFIANSEFSKRTIESFGINSKDVIKVPLGIPKAELRRINKQVAKEALGYKPSDFLVLTSSVNIASPRKGSDRLIEITNKINANSNNIYFLTLGSVGSPQFALNEHFHSFGEVWNADFKSIIFSAADIIASTSYEETFGQTIIEGYACGTGAIVFNNAALPELVKDGETGFIVEDSIDFANKITFLSNNLDRCIIFGENGYNLFLNDYTSQNQLNNLLKYF